MEKPTKQKIQDMLKSRRVAYSALRSEQKKDNKYYENTHDLGIPANSGYHEVRTGTGRAIVEVASRRLLGTPADESAPRKNTKDYEELNSKRKLFIKAFVNQYLDVIKESFKKALLRGESYYRVLLDESQQLEEPQKQKGESKEDFGKRLERWELECTDAIPISFTTPDPMTIYPSLDQELGVPRDVIVCYSRTVGDVKAKWPQWSNAKNKKDETHVEWIEYWGTEYRAYFADWEPILVSDIYKDGILPNIFGVPFVRMTSGFGLKDWEGRPEVEARGILYNARSRITALERAVSFQDSDIALHSHRTGVVRTRGTSDQDKEAAEQYAATITTAPGMVRTEVEGGPTFELDLPAPLNQALFAQSAYLQGLLEQEFHMALLSGYTPPGVTSGVQQGMSLGWARADYENAIKNQERGLSVAIGIVLRLIETTFKKPVTVRATTIQDDKEIQKDIVISPDDIDGYYTVKMKFKAEDPARADVLSLMGQRLRNDGTISHETNLSKYQGFDDPHAEMVKIAVEKFIQENPLIAQRMAAEFARQWGVEEAEVRTAEAQALQRRTGTPGEVMEPASRQVRQHRRGLETPAIEGAIGEFPAERIQGL